MEGLAMSLASVWAKNGPSILLLRSSRRPAVIGAAAASLAERGWRVYSLDLLGFGASEQPACNLENRIWGLQISAFLEQVVRRPAVVSVIP